PTIHASPRIGSGSGCRAAETPYRRCRTRCAATAPKRSTSMLKLLGWVGVIAVAAWAGATTNHGCRDMISSHTHLTYYPVRDMRRSVALMPQKVSVRAPDSLSVPITGKEWAPDQNELMANRDKATARFADTVVANDDSSVARGERVFHTFCVPCHG